MFNLCHTCNILQNPTATHKVKCAWVAQCKGYSVFVNLLSCVAAQCNNTIHHKCQTGWESLNETGQCEVGPDKYYCPDHHPNNTKLTASTIDTGVKKSDSTAENKQNCKTTESKDNLGSKKKDEGNSLECRLRNNNLKTTQNEVCV